MRINIYYRIKSQLKTIENKRSNFRKSNTVSRNESKLRAMFQEHIAGSLLRIYADPIVSDNSWRGGWYFELFC